MYEFRLNSVDLELFQEKYTQRYRQGCQIHQKLQRKGVLEGRRYSSEPLYVNQWGDWGELTAVTAFLPRPPLKMSFNQTKGTGPVFDEL